MNEPLVTNVREGFIRIRGEVAYDGKNFSGWGMQPDQRTVQGAIEDAFTQIIGGPRTVVQCAGRTDAGVHATGQVMHLDVPLAWGERLADLAYKVNAILDDDVVIKALVHTNQNFDARFAALSRSYTYFIKEGLRDPLSRERVYQHRNYLDVAAMNEASQVLIGLHDFSAFCKKTDYGTSIRNLKTFTWTRTPDDLIRIDITSDAFCYSMVRALVGAVISIGEGKRTKEWLADYLARGERDFGVFMAPAHPLTLVNVEYPPEEEYASRIEKTLKTRLEDQDLEPGEN
jgi:tRNA pseudouridine38-40 synthase